MRSSDSRRRVVSVAFGREVEGVGEADQPSADGDDSNHRDEAPDTDARGAHGSDFAVSGEAAEAEQDADQHSHGDGDGEHVGQGEENDLDDRAQRCAVADDQFEQVRQIAHEEDEGEERSADEGVREHFFQDVPRQDAHRFEPALSLSCWFLWA